VAEYAVMLTLIIALSVPNVVMTGAGEGARLARVYATLQDRAAAFVSPTSLVGESARRALAQAGYFVGLEGGQADVAANRRMWKH